MKLKSWIASCVRPTETKTETIRGGLLKGAKKILHPSSYFQIKWGLSERELHPHFRKLSQGIKTAIDIGAAEGDYTLYFLQKTPAKRVIAFEPQNDLMPSIQTNLVVNHLEHDPRLELHETFLGSAANDCLDTLDDFTQTIQGPCLIKMDVERNEFAILKGCPKLLEKDVRWIIEIHTPELATLCREHLQSYGFQVKMVSPAWWRKLLPELRGEYVQWMIASKPAINTLAA